MGRQSGAATIPGEIVDISNHRHFGIVASQSAMEFALHGTHPRHPEPVQGTKSGRDRGSGSMLEKDW